MNSESDVLYHKDKDMCCTDLRLQSQSKADLTERARDNRMTRDRYLLIKLKHQKDPNIIFKFSERNIEQERKTKTISLRL